MKLKKIFLTFAIIAILSLTFVLGISATENDFILSNDTFGSGLPEFGFSEVQYKNNHIVFIHGLDFVGYQPREFQTLVKAYDCDSYESWIEKCEEVTYSGEGLSANLYFWLDEETFGCTEDYFNKLYNYNEVSQSDYDLLEENLEFSQNQVESLLQTRLELMAENRSLENQLKLKFDGAYLEGMNTTSGLYSIIPILVALMTVFELVTMVIVIVSKIKNRKKGR